MTTVELPESPKVPADSAAETEAEGNSDVLDLVSVLGGLRERVSSELGRGVLDLSLLNFPSYFPWNLLQPSNRNDSKV